MHRLVAMAAVHPEDTRGNSPVATLDSNLEDILASNQEVIRVSNQEVIRVSNQEAILARATHHKVKNEPHCKLWKHRDSLFSKTTSNIILLLITASLLSIICSLSKNPKSKLTLRLMCNWVIVRIHTSLF